MEAPEPCTLLLVRHAEQERDGHDGELTERGQAQAAHLASAVGLGRDDVLVSSTRRRAVATATAIGRDPTALADLDEFRFGDQWTWADADARQDLVLWRLDHGSEETLGRFQARVEGAVAGLTRAHAGRRVVAVVHSGVIDALLRWALGASSSPWTAEAVVAHASITELRHWDEGRHPTGAPRHTEIRRVGDVAHLPVALITGR